MLARICGVIWGGLTPRSLSPFSFIKIAESFRDPTHRASFYPQASLATQGSWSWESSKENPNSQGHRLMCSISPSSTQCDVRSCDVHNLESVSPLHMPQQPARSWRTILQGWQQSPGGGVGAGEEGNGTWSQRAGPHLCPTAPSSAASSRLSDISQAQFLQLWYNKQDSVGCNWFRFPAPTSLKIKFNEISKDKGCDPGANDASRLLSIISWLIYHSALTSWWQGGGRSSTLFIFQVPVQRGRLPSNFHRSSQIHSAWTSKLIWVVRGYNYTIWLT